MPGSELRSPCIKAAVVKWRWHWTDELADLACGLPLLLASCVTLGRSFPLNGFSFLIYKMGIIIFQMVILRIKWIKMQNYWVDKYNVKDVKIMLDFKYDLPYSGVCALSPIRTKAPHYPPGFPANIMPFESRLPSLSLPLISQWRTQLCRSCCPMPPP